MITESHSTTHEMKRMEEEANMWETEIDMEENQVLDGTKMFVEIVTENG